MGMWTVLEVVLLGALLMYASVSYFIITYPLSLKMSRTCTLGFCAICIPNKRIKDISTHWST